MTLTWTDPVDKYATPEGEQAQDPQQLVSVWDHTVLVRKTGSQPAGPNDGTVVTSSSVRNQYQTTGYTDTGLTNDTTYYYAVFAYNKDGVPSAGAFTSAMPQAGTPLSQLAEGTIIKINENGCPVEFYLAKHNYEPGLNGEGRELVVRKDCYNQQAWNTANRNYFESSSILAWLNSSYLSLFHSNVVNLIGSTSFKCSPGGDNIPDIPVSVFTFPVFLLSSAELGRGYIGDGDRLPIIGMPGISAEKAQLNGVPVDQWTRTPYRSSMAGVNTNVVYLDENGQRDETRCDYSKGIRPCFTLPSDCLVDSDLLLDGDS